MESSGGCNQFDALSPLLSLSVSLFCTGVIGCNSSALLAHPTRDLIGIHLTYSTEIIFGLTKQLTIK